MSDKTLADKDPRPLMAAILRQAIQDLYCKDVARRLDAVMFFAKGDFPFYAEALDLPADGLELLRSGRIREMAHRAYVNEHQREWRATHGIPRTV